MEKRLTQLQSFKENELPGLWNKSWVRPYESLWSILNTYKAVNVISDNAHLMKIIGINLKTTISKDYFLEDYGIFCNVSKAKNDIDVIVSQLVPLWYKEQMSQFVKKKDVSDFFSDKISYCPKCMENGYHSILHQLKGIHTCPLHKNEKMVSYLKQRYVFGKQSLYHTDQRAVNRLLAFTSRNVGIRKSLNFEDLSIIPFPLGRTKMPEISKFIQGNCLRNDFDYIKPIGADIYDKNVIPEIGTFLLKCNLKPDIIIYNIEETERSVIEKINKRISKSGLPKQLLETTNRRTIFKYVYMNLYIAEKLKCYTLEEIDYKCYQIERGRYISSSDELGILLLYLLFTTGDERVEESLKSIREIITIRERYNTNYQYYSSDLCIHELEISDLSIAAQYYILEEYINSNFINFQKYIEKLGGMEKPCVREDIILFPVHIIYTEEKDVIKIYRY